MDAARCPGWDLGVLHIKVWFQASRFFCICEKHIKAFVASEGDLQNVINILKWSHLDQRWKTLPRTEQTIQPVSSPPLNFDFQKLPDVSVRKREVSAHNFDETQRNIPLMYFMFTELML